MIPSALAGVNISTEAHVMINIAITNLIFIKPAFQLTLFTNEIFNLIERRYPGLKSSNGIIPARNQTKILSINKLNSKNNVR